MLQRLVESTARPCSSAKTAVQAGLFWLCCSHTRDVFWPVFKLHWLLLCMFCLTSAVCFPRTETSWHDTRCCCLLFLLSQAAQRLVQLAHAVLQRFSQGSKAAAEQAQPAQQQPGQQLRSSLASSSSKLPQSVLVSLAPPSLVYTSFAPVVVSTLKVGGRAVSFCGLPGADSDRLTTHTTQPSKTDCWGPGQSLTSEIRLTPLSQKMPTAWTKRAWEHGRTVSVRHAH